jgi:hypothetical protein
VKLQFKTVSQQGLKHYQEFRFIKGVIDLGKNVVSQFVDPFRTAQNLILWNVIGVSYASLQADVPHPEYAVAPVFTGSCRWNGSFDCCHFKGRCQLQEYDEQSA